MQSASITTNIVSSHLAQVRCTPYCDKVCLWLVTGKWFSPGTSVSSTNKNGRYDITEILLKVALKHHYSNPNPCLYVVVLFWCFFVVVVLYFVVLFCFVFSFICLFINLLGGLDFFVCFLLLFCFEHFSVQ
jgi:hypothetical protein